VSMAERPHLLGKTSPCIYSIPNSAQVRRGCSIPASGCLSFTADFLKLATYLLFFSLIIVRHGLPLNMIRDVYVTARSFVTRFRALTRYLSATRDMDRRYPNATEVELNDMSDRTCIICRDELALRDPQAQQAGPNTTPKKLPCGHIFHFNCLRSWLERQQSCPTW
jgi:E3 ubiquitin-protein ligase synoviolin